MKTSLIGNSLFSGCLPSLLHLRRFVLLLLITLVVATVFSFPARAIPSLIPHPHQNPAPGGVPGPGAIPGVTDGDTTWINGADPVPDPDPNMPNVTAHQHRDRHALNGASIPFSGGNVTVTNITHPNAPGAADDLGFGSYAVWDNRNWRFNTTAMTDPDGVGPMPPILTGASLPNYAHGFIQQGAATAVRYRFDDSFDPDGPGPMPTINRWFQAGSDAAAMRAAINSAYTTWEAAINGLELNVNSIPIVRSLDFMEVMAAGAGVPAQPTDIEVFLGGLPVGVLGGWNPLDTSFRFSDLGLFDLNDVPGAQTPNDLNGNGIDENKVDFNWVAIHETGHSIGLGHFGASVTQNTMNATINLDQNGINMADIGSQDGGRDLYSIPLPTSIRENVRPYIGSKANPTITFDRSQGSMGQLLFTPGQINFADLAGGFSQIVDPTFSSDQLLGSFIRVTPLDYGGVTTAGLHYFSGGTLTIDNGTATQVGDQVYLTANFDIYFLNDTVENGSRVIDDFTILLTPTINNTIGSNLLDELSATAFGGEGLFLDFFFKSSGTYEGVDLVAITKGFTENGFIEATYYLGPNGTVPEPPTLYLIASVLAGFRMCRWRYCG